LKRASIDADLDELRHQGRRIINERLGLCCYVHEDDENLVSLWRDSDDTQLTPWVDVGPQGMIWVLRNWQHEGQHQYLLILERRDDTATPPVLRQALMHLPSGRQTDFIFAGDRGTSLFGIDRVNMGHDDPPLLLVWPHDARERDDILGAALYDAQFRELIGPCIGAIWPEGEQHQYVRVTLRQAGLPDTKRVFDYRAVRYVEPAEYTPASLDAADQVAPEQIEVIHFPRLTLQATLDSPLRLDTATLAALIAASGDTGLSLKYEGVPIENAGDGMLDITPAELPKNATALLLEDRWGELRLLVLKQDWRQLGAGSVLALQGKTRARTVAEDGIEALFLDIVLGFLGS
jgi:hypothetical protein